MTNEFDKPPLDSTPRRSWLRFSVRGLLLTAAFGALVASQVDTSWQLEEQKQKGSPTSR